MGYALRNSVGRQTGRDNRGTKDMARERKRHHRFGPLLAPLAVMVLLAAACGGDDDGATTDATDGATDDNSTDANEEPSAELSGEPVRIGSIYPISSAAISFPDLEYMAEIAVRVVNDNGGIHGRPLEWTHCDDKSDPNVAATCADQIINQDDVIALVQSVGVQGNIIWPFITEHNVINWFNVPIWPEDGNSELSYPTGLGIFAHQNVGTLVEDGEFERVRCMVSESPLADTVCGFAQAALAERGITDFEIIKYPPGTTSFQPFATRVVTDEADAVVIVGTDAITAPVSQALADAGADVTLLQPSTTVGSHTLEVADETGLELRVAGSWGVDDELFPARAEMLANIERYADEVGAPDGFDTISDSAISMYLGILTFAEAMNSAAEVSVEAFQADVAASPIVTGMAPPIDWSTPGPIETSPRVVTVYSTAETVEDGQLRSESTSFVSAFPGVVPPTVEVATE